MPAIVLREWRIERYGDMDFEVIEVQYVRTGRYTRKRKVGVGFFNSYRAASDYIRFTFGDSASYA